MQLLDSGICLHTVIGFWYMSTYSYVYRLLASYLAFSLNCIANLEYFEEFIQRQLCLHAYFGHLSLKLG